MERLNGFGAWEMHMALKLHFKDNGYDFHTYRGRLGFKHYSFEKRRDKHFYEVLAKKKDPLGLLLTHFMDSGPDAWIGDILGDGELETRYLKRIARIQSILYTAKSELEKYEHSLQDMIMGDNPVLCKYIIQRRVSYEVAVAMDSVMKFSSSWKRHSSPAVSMSGRLISRYSPFVSADYEPVRKYLLTYFSERAINNESATA